MMLMGMVAAIPMNLRGATTQGQAALPSEWQVRGKLQPTDQWLVAQGPVTITAPLTREATTTVRVRLGQIKATASCRVETKEGKPLELSLSAVDAEYRPGLIGKQVIQLPDACVQIGLRGPGGEWLFRDRYFVRPHPHWYKGDERERALKEWEKFPAATRHALELRVEARGAYVGFWIDDRFVGGGDVQEPTGVSLALSPGNALEGVRVSPLPPSRSRFVPIGFHGYRRPAALRISETPLRRAAAQTINGVPFHVAGDGDEIDVGVSRWLGEKTGPEEFVDAYYTRSSFDSRPEDILLAAPTDDYCCAHVLCVVDPDPGKTPVLTLRLTRFLVDCYDSGGRGEAIADSSVRLVQTGGRWPEGCQPIGTVKVKTAQGEASLPLLHVTIPVKSGHIQDVLDEKGFVFSRSTQSLDLELTKELHPIATTNHSTYSTKPLGKPSGVCVYALTLERSPVKVRLRSRQPGNVFYASENPAFYIVMENRGDVPFQGKLSWRITDFYGQSTLGEKDVAVPAPADDRPHEACVELGLAKWGWHRAELWLHDRNGRLIWEHPTSFAILPPDTRRAGRESPYGTWWFRASHVGTESLEEIGPLLRRAGFRHVCPGGQGPDGETLGKYGLSLAMYPNFVGAGDRAPALLDAAVAKHPGVGWALVFHESGFGEQLAYPPEFLGREPPKLTEKQQTSFKKQWDKAIAYSKYCREKHPGLKLIVGNGSLPFLVEFMRQGYPREYVDAFGDESLQQLVMPEAPPGAHQSIFWQRQYAKLYKYDVPDTSCYEWRGRPTTPGNLTEMEQAQLYARDVLQGLAYRMRHVNPGEIHDAGDAYYYSRWGSGGLCHRYPALNPKISYVALATLTRELDGAVLERILNTGSPSIFALEFTQGAGLVYALWLPRGQRDVVTTFADDTSFSLTDMNGNARELKTAGRRAEIAVFASPTYLKTRVAITGLRGGPTRCEPPPENLAVVDSLTDPNNWEIVKQGDKELDNCHFEFPRRVGKIDVAVVSDSERQRALQLTLQPQGDVPWPVTRYLVLKARSGIAVPRAPTAIGVWVKGNSCWGRVFWEFEDAKGEVFTSIGAPCDGWSVGDWKCRTFINFDGWNYLSVKLPFKYSSGFYGPPQCNWTCRGGDGVVNYPIRFTRLIVELRDRVAYLTDAVEVPDRVVRLRDLSATYDSEQPEVSRLRP